MKKIRFIGTDAKGRTYKAAAKTMLDLYEKIVCKDIIEFAVPNRDWKDTYMEWIENIGMELSDMEIIKLIKAAAGNTVNRVIKVWNGKEYITY